MFYLSQYEKKKKITFITKITEKKKKYTNAHSQFKVQTDIYFLKS